MIDYDRLARFSGIDDFPRFQTAHREWMKKALSEKERRREAAWSESVADGDGKPEETERIIREFVTVPFDLMIVDPEIEAWFFPSSFHPKQEMKRAACTSGKTFDRYLSGLIDNTDIAEMNKYSPGFSKFKESILRSLKEQYA